MKNLLERVIARFLRCPSGSWRHYVRNFAWCGLFAFGFIQVALADTSEYHFSITCDPGSSVKILAVISYNGDEPADFPYSLSNLPRAESIYDAKRSFSKYGAPMTICDLGTGRAIAIKGFIGDMGPGRSGLWLYVNRRLFPVVVSFSSVPEIIIKKDPEDFFVDIEQCVEVYSYCSNTRFTAPSFACDEAQSILEKFVCSMGDLPTVDLLLNKVYQEDRISQPALSKSLVKGERVWLAELASRCHLDLLPNDKHGTLARLLQENSCLLDLYKRRINELKKLNEKKP